MRLGLNTFEIYVSDIAGNGMLEPAHIVEYRKVDALWALITEAEQLLDETEEGNAPGQYPAEARAALGQAIAAALSVANDDDATQRVVNVALAALQKALDEYNAAEVEPPTRSSTDNGATDAGSEVITFSEIYHTGCCFKQRCILSCNARNIRI